MNFNFFELEIYLYFINIKKRFRIKKRGGQLFNITYMLFQYYIEEIGGWEVSDEEWDGTEEGRYDSLMLALHGLETEFFDDTLPKESYRFIMLTQDLRDIMNWLDENHANRRKVSIRN